MADVRVSVPASSIRRLRIYALDYMRRTGAADPGLLERVDELWADGTTERTHLSMAEAAAMLGVSLSTVKRRVGDGSLPSAKVGRLVRIPVSAVRPS